MIFLDDHIGRIRIPTMVCAEEVITSILSISKAVNEFEEWSDDIV